MTEDIACVQMTGIEGWFSVAEASVLYRAAVDAIGKLPDDAVVEIGSYHGRSTVVLAQAVIDSHPTQKVIAIDPHEGSLTGLRTEPSWDAFNRNMKESGVDDMVTAIRKSSQDIDWAAPISVLFIDGLHDEASVFLDYARFGKFVSAGGIVAFHDYSNPDYPGVRIVVDRLLESGKLLMLRRPSGRDPHDTLAICRKQAQISIIIPTCGRPSLERALNSVANNGGLILDEIIVVGDGPQPAARQILDCFHAIPFSYAEHGPTRVNGIAQRNFAMPLATGTHLAFLDDDDEYVNGGVSAIRAAANQNPGRVLVFKEESKVARHPWGVVWKDKEVRNGNVGTQGIVVPNVRGRIGVWGNHYQGDYDFLRSTVDLYPNKDADVVWVDKIIARLY
jgi:hypothetical protein